MTSTAGMETKPLEAPEPAPDTGAGASLWLRDISKRFGPVQANQDITIMFRAGEIHALLGENGSGKSTLLSIASGSQTPDTGTVEIAGSCLTHASPRLAMRLGLGMAYQHLTTVAGLTVAENLYLGAPDELRPALLEDVRVGDRQAGRVPDRRPRRGPDGDASRLPTCSCWRSCRRCCPNPRCCCWTNRPRRWDTPTCSASTRLIRGLAAQGLCVVYVSHRLPEVLDVADRVTVLRDGVSQGTYDAADMSEANVVAMMIGRPLDMAFPPIDQHTDAAVMFSVSQLFGRRFGPIDLELRRGEIVGIAGAEGNGQVQFLRALAGVEPSHGEVVCAGKRIHVTSPPSAIRAGLILLSADRKRESIFTALSVRANATLQVLRLLRPVRLRQPQA